MGFLCFGKSAEGEQPVEEKKPAPPAAKKDDFVVSHTARWMYWWDLLIMLVILASLVIVPLRIGFDLTDDTDWLGPDVVIDVLLIADIVLTFFKTYETEGEVVKVRSEIASRYLKGRFAIDVLSSAPVSYVALAAGTSHPAFRLNRMIRLGRLADFLLSWEKNSNLKPSVIGIVKCVFVVLYMSHFVGCAFHGLTLLVNSPAPFTSTIGFAQKSFWSRYFRSLMWALVSLTGYNASIPVHWAEVAMSVAVTICSIALFGTIIGIFGNLITNLDSSKLYFRQKMDAINDYMMHKKISAPLQHEVNAYYAYMWKSGKALEANEAVEDLPANLKQRMSFQTCYMSIRAVPFFVDVKDDMAFMGDVVKVLRPRIGLPNSFIVKKGEMGSEMYFISRGELNVVADNGFVVFTMKDGMFFGEIALIYKTKRTATIVARTFCDMYVLTKEDFAKVMRKYPEQSRGIKTVAKERMEANQKKEEEGRRAKEEAERARIDAEAKAQQAEEEARLANIGEQVHSEGSDDEGAGVAHGDRTNGDGEEDEDMALIEHDAASPARPQTSEAPRRGRRSTGASTASPQSDRPDSAISQQHNASMDLLQTAEEDDESV
jgi:CRP-like cAMP-binding protein